MWNVLKRKFLGKKLLLLPIILLLLISSYSIFSSFQEKVDLEGVTSYFSEGETVEYNIDATYTVYNAGNETVENDFIYINLPLNYSFYQKSYFVSMNPRPTRIVTDVDSNVYAVVNLKNIEPKQRVSIEARYRVKVSSYKMNFPVEDAAYAPLAIARKYLQETQFWPIHNETLRQISSDLGRGKDNPYKILESIAWWVHEHGDYELNSITASNRLGAGRAIKKTDRGLIVYGVCDEFADVIITLCRIQSIPARTVQGLVYIGNPIISYYENSTSNENWTGHAWPQIYLHPTGWFDIELLVYAPTPRIGNYQNNHIIFGIEGKKLRPVGVGAVAQATVCEVEGVKFKLEVLKK